MRSMPRTVTIVCCLAFAALLAGCASARSGTTLSAATPTPSADPATQAYVSLLRHYYVPMANANGSAKNCFIRVEQTLARLQAGQMAHCQTPMAAELTAAQTLRAQLAETAPPAQWQAQHAALKSAVQALINLTTEQVQAIDAGDVNRFLNTGMPVAGAVMTQFCDPIAQIDAGPPPLTPILPQVDAQVCGGGGVG